MGSTKLTNCPGTRQLGTTVVRDYKVGRWKRRRAGVVCGLGREGDLQRSWW